MNTVGNAKFPVFTGKELENFSSIKVVQEKNDTPTPLSKHFKFPTLESTRQS